LTGPSSESPDIFSGRFSSRNPFSKIHFSKNFIPENFIPENFIPENLFLKIHFSKNIFPENFIPENPFFKNSYPLQILWIQSQVKYNIRFIYPYSPFGDLNRSLYFLTKSDTLWLDFCSVQK